MPALTGVVILAAAIITSEGLSRDDPIGAGERDWFGGHGYASLSRVELDCREHSNTGRVSVAVTVGVLSLGFPTGIEA
jgi:hypothetical protein